MAPDTIDKANPIKHRGKASSYQPIAYATPDETKRAIPMQNTNTTGSKHLAAVSIELQGPFYLAKIQLLVENDPL
jgi:hypothetical protein